MNLALSIHNKPKIFYIVVSVGLVTFHLSTTESTMSDVDRMYILLISIVWVANSSQGGTIYFKGLRKIQKSETFSLRSMAGTLLTPS